MPDAPRESSRWFLINEMDLENGSEAEGSEDDRDAPYYGQPMTVGDPSPPIIPPLAFDDAHFVLQPEDPHAIPPPRSSPAKLPTQPSVALLLKSHTWRGSDTVTLPRDTPAARGVPYPHDTDGLESVRSSISSSILPPSYCSHYTDPGNAQNDLDASWRTTGEGENEGESVEDEDGAGRPRRRSFDGGVRLAGGRPGEGDSAAPGADEVSGMPPAYHDS